MSEVTADSWRWVALRVVLLTWATVLIVSWSALSPSPFRMLFVSDDGSVDLWPVDDVARRRSDSDECERGVVLRSAFNSVPSPPPPPADRTPCSLADWTEGEWVYADDIDGVFRRTGLYMQYANHFQPDYNSTTREPWRWEWRPHAAVCRELPAFDPVRLCSALGNRSVLFVGDSLQANMIAAFRHQLEAVRGDDDSSPRPCRNPDDWSDEYEQSVVICPSGARLDYIRNDHLSLIDRDDMACGDRCFPWVQALGEYATLVLNTGLHVVDIDLYDFRTRETVAYLRRHFAGRVIYRLASAGHENCMTYTRPWTRAQYDADAAVYRAKTYRWHFVDAYNDIAWRWYSTLSNAVILDTDAFVRLRPDVHRSAGDCLHHLIPGPWDYAVRMLYHVLVGDLS